MIRTLAVESYRSLRWVVMPLAPLTVVTGANGTGKSSLYRSLRLLAGAARDGAIAALAREGGLPSTMWAGPEGSTRPRRGVDDGRPVHGTVRTKPVALRLGYASDDLGYAIDLGLPTPSEAGSAFGNDPVIKRESVFAGPTPRPAAVLVDRHNGVVKVRDGSGGWDVITDRLPGHDSMLSSVADPRRAPELVLVRESLRSWRFYDQVRTDADAPARTARIGTRTPVLAADGGDLAAALQTIIEVGDADALRGTVENAFPGSSLVIDVQHGRFEVLLSQHGMLRPLSAAELSDGTLRYLLWVAALLTPRPPDLMVLNEPETSLHPSLLAPLADLTAACATRCQVVVVSHSTELAGALTGSGGRARRVELVKEKGQTLVDGQRMLDEPSWTWPSR